MYQLDLTCVPAWRNLNNKWFPQSMNVDCPFCANRVNYRPEEVNDLPSTKTIVCTASCPNCGKKAYFWAVEPGPANDTSKKGCRCLSMFPAPHLPRQPIKGKQLVPELIRRAYVEAVNVFNARVWTATATCCRRTLEAVMKDLLKEEYRKLPLYEQLQKLKTAVDLDKPLVDLSHTVRKGGNLGAHFDLEKEPDEKTAQAILDMIEYFLEYLYTLPRMIAQLEKNLSSKESGPEDETSVER